MIIDCHTHLGRNEHIDARVDELLRSMDRSKIDKALVFAGELNNYPTWDMLDEIKPHADRLYGVASWDFDNNRFKKSVHDLKYGGWALGRRQEDMLAAMYKAGYIVAVKFYLGYYHYMPAGPEITKALKALEKVGCPVIFHCGDCLNSVKCAKLKYAHPLNVDEVAVDFPGINFIIAHMGFPWHRDAAEVCYKNSNVYADISGFVYEDFKESDKIKFKKVLEEFLYITSSNKLLFGTDWPISFQTSYVDVLDIPEFEYGCSLKPEDLSINVQRAFKI